MKKTNLITAATAGWHNDRTYVPTNMSERNAFVQGQNARETGRLCGCWTCEPRA